jgi:two-component system, OmpR family, heavy metal sensor histidine kinase CusS
VIRRATDRLLAAQVLNGSDPVQISLPAQSPDLFVGVDAAVLERLLVPLIDNSLRYARQNILVQVTALPRTAMIDIADDGPGIPEAALVHLFEPGWRPQPDDDTPGRASGWRWPTA